jgi:hypothetical protein
VQEDLKSESGKTKALENKLCFFAFAVEETSKAWLARYAALLQRAIPSVTKDSILFRRDYSVWTETTMPRDNLITWVRIPNLLYGTMTANKVNHVIWVIDLTANPVSCQPWPDDEYSYS